MFVDNQDLFKSLKLYFDNPDKEKIPEKVFTNIDMIIQNYSTHRKFFKYTFRDQMISEARLHCFKSIKKFNPKLYDNPLAYFTMVAHNAFIQVINREKRETKTIEDLITVKLMEKFNPKTINQKITDVNLPTKNITFSPIKIIKKNKTHTYKTKEEYEEFILNKLITKYGDEKGREKFEIHRTVQKRN